MKKEKEKKGTTGSNNRGGNKREGHPCVTNATRDDEGWDQDVDYSGLVFAQNNPQDFTKETPDLNNLSVDLRQSYKHVMKQPGGKVNKLWALLDSQSTIDLFCNKKC
mmetsp:Transcript_34035/g.50009  ORF Transcript_34035/g.50009 Transcript_34035/m.50009 type:complete len:107 (+) Transcript_34035:1220-1540(+)